VLISDSLLCLVSNHVHLVAMWIVLGEGTKSLRTIGELFGGLNYAAAVIRRVRH
jgi:hypothetical protein